MSQQLDLISVFIPVYNGGRYIVETIKSVVNQTYRNIEILIVYDSNTDNSLAIINSFVNEDSKIRVFSKKNGGMSQSLGNMIKGEIHMLFESR